MTTIGETLAAIRQQVGCTVAELSERTCIRQGILEAMERDDFIFCGGDFYARGHIRSVCKELGADAAPLIERFNAEHATQRIGALLPQAPIAPNNGDHPADTDPGAADDPMISVVDESAHETSEERHRGDSGGRWTSQPKTSRRVWPLVVAAVIIAAAIISVLQAWPKGGNADEGAAPAAPPSTAVPASEPNNADSVGADSVQRAKSAFREQRKPQQTTVREPQEVNVELRAMKRSWVRVSDREGNELYVGVLDEDVSQNWSAPEEVRLNLGNAGGVRVSVNGEDKGKPGKKGEVARVTYDAEDVNGT